MTNRLINVTIDELILLGESELDAEQRRELIGRLDEHPEQWRACAMELLEALEVRNAIASSQPEPPRSTGTQLNVKTPPVKPAANSHKSPRFVPNDEVCAVMTFSGKEEAFGYHPICFWVSKRVGYHNC